MCRKAVGRPQIGAPCGVCTFCAQAAMSRGVSPEMKPGLQSKAQSINMQISSEEIVKCTAGVYVER